MDDIQVLLYIVVAIFYFISRSMKKKPVPPKPQRNMQEGTPDAAPPKPLTFEELLREFTQEPKEEAYEEPKVQPTYTPMDVPVVRNHEPEYVPNYNFSDDDAKRIYEESQRMAATTRQLSNTRAEEDAMRFKEYKRSSATSSENPIAVSIREMLRNPEEAKKAVVLAEILNRKY